MEAAFDKSKFPYNTPNHDLKKEVEEILVKQEVPLKGRVDALKPEERALYDKGLKLQEKLKEVISNPKWEIKDNETDYTSYAMEGEGGFMCIKSMSVVQGTPIEVYCFLTKEEYKTEYDEQYLKGETVQIYPANFKVTHATFKGKLFVSNRDFVLLTHVQYMPDGAIHVATSSIEDARVPKVSDPVRANTIVSFE